MKNKIIRDNINKNNINSKSKKALTLITMLVTIIVILILVGAIVLTIRKSNSIKSANDTILRSDLQSIKESYREKYNDLLFDYNGKKENIPQEEFEDVVPDEYKPDFIILPEGPAYVGDDPDTKDVAEEMGYIIGYPSDKIIIEYVNLDTIEDKIMVDFGIKETDLEIKNIKYYISKDGINWIDADSLEFSHEFSGLEEFTEYQVKIVVTDENDNDTESEIYSIKTKMRNFEAGTLKMTEDTLDGNDYISGNWTNHSVYIKINDEDDPTVKTTYSAEGANEIPKGTTSNKIMQNSGISKITLVTEKYGTTRTREYEIKIDKEKPVINSLVSNNSNPTNKNIVITGSAIDSLSGISGYQFSKDGNLDINSEGWIDITPTNKDLNLTEEIRENGVYYFYVKDVAGNVSKKEIIVDNIDKTAPALDSIKVTSPEDSTYKSGQEVTIVATFSKNIKGYPPTLKIRFGDGEERSISTGEISENTITYTYTIQDGDNGILVSTSYDGSVTDSVGNNLNVENMSLSGNVIVADTTPPTKTAPTLTSNTNSITATLKQTDLLSGINNTTIQYAIKEEDESKWGEWIIVGSDSHTFTNLIKNTVYQIKTKVSDNAGNISESNVSTISTVDITKPTLSAPPDWSNKGVVVTITYPDIPGTIKQYSTDGINWTETTDVVQTVTVEENHTTVYARVIDDTNQTSGNATYTVTCIDKSLPTVEIGTNGGNYTMNIGTSEITITTSLSARDTGGSGLELLQYQLSTSETLPLDSDTNWKNFNNGDNITETVPGGIYYIYTKVTDRARNRAEVILKSNPYIVQYQISYDANGGSGIPDEQLKVHGTDLVLSSVKPTKAGAVFAGWSTDISATVGEYRAGGKYTANEPAMLYAIWGTNVYTVRYDANGGSDAPEEQQKTHNNSLILTSKKPVREGYDFVGWNSDSSATTAQYEAGGTYNDNTDVTLYAVWRLKTYVIKYDANGGSSAPFDQTKTHGIDLELSQTPAARLGYNFLGWSTDKNATTADYQPSDMFSINANTTLYAVWAIDAHTIKYDMNGGIGQIEDQYKFYGEDLVLTTKKPTREGYTFLGWHPNKNSDVVAYFSGGTYSSEASITLYAVWQMDTFTITYDSNGGSGGVAWQTKEYWSDLIISSNSPVRYGYDLVGWNTDKNATTAEYLPGGTYSKNENATLYAIWKPTTYNVTLDVNGGNPLNPSVIEVTYGSKIGDLPIPTRDGYIFIGWGENRDDNVYYLPESILSPEDITLYAKWKEGASIEFTEHPSDTKEFINDKFWFDFSIRYRGTLTYQWYMNTTRSNVGGTPIPGATSKKYEETATDDNDGKFFYCVVTATYEGTTITKATNPASLTVIKPKVIITEQPKDTQANIGSRFGFGKNITYTSTATLTYQWYMNTTRSNVGGTLISGATTSTYESTATNDVNGKYFYCIITATLNGYSTTATTDAAKLTVIEPEVTITKNPEDARVFPGDKTIFSIAVSGITLGDDFGYQWYYNTTNSNSGGTLIPGATSIGYDVEALPSNDGRYYYCAVTANVNGYTATATSTAAKLTIKPPEIKITKHPQDCVLLEGDDRAFSVTAEIKPNTSSWTFQWYVNDTKSNVGGTPISDAIVESSINLPLSDYNGKYIYCVVTASSHGYSTSVASQAAKLTIVPNLQIRITDNPSDCTIVTGNEYYFGAGVEGTEVLSYQWYMNSTNSNVGGTPIPGATSIGCKGISTADMNGKYFYCVATTTSGGQSKSATTTPAKLILKDAYYSVTKSGKTYYADNLQLAESYAVSGASALEGGTITVLKNVPSDYVTGIKKSVTLNTNGKTVNIQQIQITSNDVTFNVNGGGSLISSESSIFYIRTKSNLNLNNVSLTVNSLDDYLIINEQAGVITLTNVTGNAKKGSLLNAGSGTITYNSGSLTIPSGIAVSNEGAGTINIKGGALTGGNIAVNSGSGTINITGGTYSTSSANVLINSSTGKLIVNGDVKLSTTANTAVIANLHASGTTEVTGATINMSGGNAALVNSGNFKLNNTDVTSNSFAIAQTGGTSNMTNTNMSSNSEVVVYCDGGNMTFNSGTYKVAGSVEKDTITVLSGTTTIAGGTYEARNGNVMVVYENGTGNIRGGTLIGGKSITSEYKYPAVSNKGSLTMTGGTIDARGAGIHTYSGVATITGGTITCTEDDGIYLEGGTAIIGSSSAAISTTSPSFSGTYGAYNKAGTLYFYNGILKGTQAAYYGNMTKRSSATFTTGISGSYKTAYYR